MRTSGLVLCLLALAEYPITEADIAAMLKGADLTVSIQSLQKQPVTLQDPVAGLAAAYAKIK